MDDPADCFHGDHDQETVTLEPGDLLVLFSDGVTEALDPAGEEFGGTGCWHVSRRTSKAGPRCLERRWLLSARFYRRAQRNTDVTALVLR